jgi:hypothetical protein
MCVRLCVEADFNKNAVRQRALYLPYIITQWGEKHGAYAEPNMVLAVLADEIDERAKNPLE